MTLQPFSCRRENLFFFSSFAGMYEISPYATFSVPGNHNRSVTTSTLDYTMQFKTFGHIEDEGSNAIIYPKHGSGKHSWHKHRYYNTEGDIYKYSLGQMSRTPLKSFDVLYHAENT